MRQHFSRRRSSAGGFLRRFIESVLVLIILAGLSLFARQLSGASIDAVPGNARAIDGDSLMVDGVEVRLWGIDAPEAAQTCMAGKETTSCGRLARQRLQALISGQAVRCAGAGNDQYDRLLAVCRAGDTELNAALVLEGFAFDYGGYGAEEAAAREAGRGVWAGDNERPRAFRQRTKAGMEQEAGLLDRIFHAIARFLHR